MIWKILPSNFNEKVLLILYAVEYKWMSVCVWENVSKNSYFLLVVNMRDFPKNNKLIRIGHSKIEGFILSWLEGNNMLFFTYNLIFLVFQ